MDLEVGSEIVPSDYAADVSHPWMVIPPEVFAGHAPRLRSLDLMGGFVILQDCPALASLSALRIDIGTAGETVPGRGDELVNQTVQALSRLQTLQHLWIDMKQFSAFNLKPSITRSLSELHVSTFGEKSPLPLLQYFNFEHASLIRTLLYDGWNDAFEARARSVPTILEVRPFSFNYSFCDWHLSAADGRSWIYYMPFLPPSASSLDYLGRNLSTLSLPITHCVQFARVRFMQLERLIVAINSRNEINRTRRRKAPPIAEQRSMRVPEDFKMECPVLHEIQLVCHRSNPQLPPVRWTVSATAIAKFIDRLLLSETYFRRIHLCNLSLDVEGGPEVTSSLETRYGIAVISSQGEPPEDLVVSDSFWSSTDRLYAAWSEYLGRDV